MNTPRYFSIRKAFLVPLGLLVLLCCILLVVVLMVGQPVAKAFILGALILPITGLFVESAFRKAVIDEQGITVYKFLRSKSLKFAELTAVETVQVRKRAFLTLCAEDEFLILSNAYGDFPELVRVLLSRVPEGTVSEETRQMAASPPVKSSDVISCWLAVALLAFILYIQLGGRLW
ncbi:hypothetical protein DESUT3_37360 [Desulfuromonas versatilis]|uniref:PH domain-containing protein n=1 Tax=Desulfuromonas versatilis TaxID=2802975 RepID=A0ABM8HUR9_9BACT|nr:PH domain-containing protein [Desulfuromonas versatilis]BCR06667.1 hypothetical protein DESUT3_37360 [Desulfuromonas versatilis]